ncbi:protein of unknown function (DUF1790) [Cylindrospermum stagnale PCC 7417]|uniref:YbjN domain-containing protein n=1 Tax=Cylindrospermum stagnale PCC 7417 TaxID=56107 RepID=K9X2B3_9NOST|nr:YbjN domain-containing protein [Cylindrospermum stagnale]AFZ26573.1 protein of unknown function (DUF1790) [Cylindrospermum stagnale PCC 7417]
MSNQTEHSNLNGDLTLSESSDLLLTVHTVSLSLTTQNNTLTECRLTFCITPEIYQRIDTQALFNLKPEIRSPFSAGAFDPSIDIQIEASLDPNLLSKLAEYATDANQAAAYLQKLSQEQPENPLLSTYSWYGLEVKQKQVIGETGYRTLWLYLQPSVINQEGISSEKIAQAMNDFTNEWTNSNSSETFAKDMAQTLEEMNHSFEELAENISEMAQTMISEVVEEVNNVLENLTEDIFETTDEVTTSETIFGVIVNFFKKSGWLFSQFAEEPVLYITYQGKNGRWNCCAKAREQQQQFVFYSVCPVTAPKSQRQAIAEFIAMANYDMIIGNFELDFRDGEIRYKTSIDVEGDRLSFACINNLVYANVNMMDKYLPGIMSVIAGDVLSTSAIKQIELIPDIPQSSDEKEQLSVVLPAKKHEELKLNPSWQTDIQKQEIKREKESHILSTLTPEEIAQFHQVSQMAAPYQRKKVLDITEKLKSAIISRIGELGEETFTRATTFFLEFKLEAKNFKLIQRYSGLAGRARLLSQRLNNWSEQHGELPVNSPEEIALVELDKLFWLIEQRLQELPAGKFEGRKEVELLIEIEDFREKLAFYERDVSKIAKNLETGLAST